MQADRSPILMANIIFAAIVVGIVAGVGLRGEAQSPAAPPAITAPSDSPPATLESSPTAPPTRPESGRRAERAAAPDAEPGVAALAPPHNPETDTPETDPPAAGSADPPAAMHRAPDNGLEVAWQSSDSRPEKMVAPPSTDGRGRIGMFSFADIVERVSPAVVTVSSTRSVDAADGDGLFDRFFGNRDHPNVEGHGSGFVMRANGIILTNNHVVEDADELKVRLRDGREFDAEVVGRDPQTDVAVLRIDASNLPTLTLGDSDRMRVGDWVLAVGSPFRRALETSVTSGIISGKGRGNVGIVEYEEFLQTDAAINPGNSGGPLINLEGDVIGINTAIATRNGGYQGVSFAIPMNFARPVVQALLEDGRVRRAWLGVSIQDVTPELARGLHLDVPEGVAIVEVYADMPADAAGLRNGDIVLSMDSEPTPNSSHFRNRVSLSHPGQRVAFEILRDGDVKKVDVILGEMTDDVIETVQRGRRSVPARPPSAPDFGMQLSELTAEVLEEYDLSRSTVGVVVTAVVHGSAAAEAGLEPGDVIRAVNRQEVESLRQFGSAVASVPNNRPIVLNVKRGNQSFFVTLDPTS